jgi:hypothetical protein
VLRDTLLRLPDPRPEDMRDALQSVVNRALALDLGPGPQISSGSPPTCDLILVVIPTTPSPLYPAVKMAAEVEVVQGQPGGGGGGQQRRGTTGVMTQVVVASKARERLKGGWV